MKGLRQNRAQAKRTGGPPARRATKVDPMAALRAD